jgi:hypothetical protein
MISPETRVQIRHYFYAEHWKIGTIARELGVYPDTVSLAIEAQRFGGSPPLRPSILDPFLEFIRQTLDQHPRLCATRIYQMAQDRGYSGSVVQLRRAVARLRPKIREPFLCLQTFPGQHYGKSRVMVRNCGNLIFCQRIFTALFSFGYIMRLYRASSHSMRCDDSRRWGARVAWGPVPDGYLQYLRFKIRSVVDKASPGAVQKTTFSDDR